MYCMAIHGKRSFALFFFVKLLFFLNLTPLLALKVAVQRNNRHNLPSVNVSASELTDGMGLLQAFVLAGLAKSNGEARRLVQGGGAKVNDAPQNDHAAILTDANTIDGVIKLSFGKKRHVLLKISD